MRLRLPEDSGEPGCGYGLLKTSHKDPFYAECRIHDINYGLKRRGQQGLSQREVDQLFYEGMMQRVAAEPRWYRRSVLWLRAHTYYGIVRLFGSLFWHEEQDKHEDTSNSSGDSSSSGRV